ncbi:hypothetical protein L9F63_023509 [Diploptera punctata]|uniref:Uncharacterized protein n=1 Tax=Diploptera punctata TaxID=6984 RepID=A0AAD7ZIH0_DIPPU|nr:hypothetical protein L9F63_023509 [Diploptera punctata]
MPSCNTQPEMKLWIFTIIILLCTLEDAESNCVNTPCTSTDYKTYSNCLSNQCPNAVVATGCPENKCSSVNCNTCSTSNSNACCQSCCRSTSCECTNMDCNSCSSTSNACCASCCSRFSKCNCQSVNCDSCQGYGTCCQTCCKKSDCCESTNREQCCNNNPNTNCCPQPTPKDVPVERIIIPYPNITLPNITIIVNHTAPLVQNTQHYSVNQNCQNSVSHGNMSLCLNYSSPSFQNCCTIPYREPCYPIPYPPFYYCPPMQYTITCGPQCLTQLQAPQPSPPQRVLQPMYIQQQPPVFQPLGLQQTPIYQPPIFQQPIIQPPIVQQPIVQQPIIQPPIIQQPILQSQIYQQRMSGCYVNYQYNQCPQYCTGGCTYLPYGNFQTAYQGSYQSCMPSTSFPFIRCPQYAYGSGNVAELRPYMG